MNQYRNIPEDGAKKMNSTRTAGGPSSNRRRSPPRNLAPVTASRAMVPFSKGRNPIDTAEKKRDIFKTKVKSILSPLSPRTVKAVSTVKTILSPRSKAFGNGKGNADAGPSSMPIIPYEAQEPTTLTKLGCQMRNGGIRESNDLLPVSPSPSAVEFRKACELLPHLDPTALMNEPRARSVRLIGTKLALTSHQFWQAYQILSRRGGGMLCDDPGLGKTYEVLAACALKALISDSRRKVEAYWESEALAAKPKRSPSAPRAKTHLPRDTVPGSGLRCPSQRDFDVCCFCVGDSPTREIGEAMSPGVSLIHVPSRTIPGWISAIESAEMSAGFYNVIICHESAATPPKLRRDMGELKSWGMDAVLPEGHEGNSTVTDTRELVWRCTPSRKLYQLPQESCIVLTTFYNPTLYNTMKWKFPKLFCNMPAGGIYALQVGLHFISEAHEVWSERQLPMIMAACHKHINKDVGIWYETATPFQKGVEEIAFAMNLLEVIPGAVPLNQAIPKLNELYQDAIFNKKFPQKEELFEDMFIETFQGIALRFIDTSEFFGKPISSIQRIEPTVISRETPREYRRTVQTAVDEIKQGIPTGYPYADCFDISIHSKRALERLYFLSMFPGAANSVAENGFLFDEESFRDMIKSLVDRSKTDQIPFVEENWKRFTEGSEKLKYIVSQVDRMNADRRLRPQVETSPRRTGGVPPRQTDRGLKKMVITTPTLGTALFIYRALLQPDLSLKGMHPVLLHESLLPSQKRKVLEDWADLSANKRHHRVLVTTFAAGGTGTNLQAASYQVLTSPLPLASQQFQAFRRTNRTGQALPVEQRLLVLEDSPVDRILMTHHANQKIVSDPYRVNTPLELGPFQEAIVRRTQRMLGRARQGLEFGDKAAATLGSTNAQGESWI